MSGNCIGTKAQVSRALILPHFGENGKGVANIGEDSLIGLRNSAAANLKYPAQLRDGLTVLGAGAHVPRGFVIGPGCLVGAEVSPQQLRGLKELRKGSTVLCSTERVKAFLERNRKFVITRARDPRRGRAGGGVRHAARAAEAGQEPPSSATPTRRRRTWLSWSRCTVRWCCARSSSCRRTSPSTRC